MSWPNKVYSQSMVPKYTTYNDTNMLFRYSGVKRDGKYLDASGNGNNSLSSVCVSNSNLGPVMGHYTSSIYSTVTTTTVNPATGSLTLSVFVSGDVFPGLTYGFLAGPAAPAPLITPYSGILLAVNNFYLNWYNGGIYRSISVGPLSMKLKYLVSYNIDVLNNRSNLYVNGVFINFLTPIDIVNPGAGINYSLGASNYSAGAGSFNGLVADGTLWSRALTVTDLRKEWLQYAPMVQLKTGWGAKVSIANESTVGNFVGNGSTPFEILSGTWKTSLQLVDGELHKVIECVAAGTVWLDRHFMGINSSEAAYGSWRGLFYHAPSATPTTVALTATAKATPSVTTGYYFRGYNQEARFGRYAAGAFTDIRTLPAPGAALALAEFHTTRKFNNEWQQNARLAPGAYGPTWTDWQTSTPPDVSNTYLTSEGMSFTANAGDWLSLGTVRDTYALTKFLGEFLPTEV